MELAWIECFAVRLAPGPFGLYQRSLPLGSAARARLLMHDATILLGVKA